MRTAHPWAELLIALCLVVTSGIPAVVTAVVATALAVAYLVLIVRAVQSPEPTDCACFGVVGAEQVSGWTVLRNVLAARPLRDLRVGGPGRTLAAAVGGRARFRRVVAGRDGGGGRDDRTRRAPERAEARPPRTLSTIWTSRTTSGPRSPTSPSPWRTGVSSAFGSSPDHAPSSSLRCRGTCSSCLPTIEAAPHWRERLPEVDIHLLYAERRRPGHVEPVTSRRRCTTRSGSSTRRCSCAAHRPRCSSAPTGCSRAAPSPATTSSAPSWRTWRPSWPSSRLLPR